MSKNRQSSNSPHRRQGRCKNLPPGGDAHRTIKIAFLRQIVKFDQQGRSM